jgi:S1-C subfamily serine protease
MHRAFPRPSGTKLARPVTGVDWVILAFVVLLALFGAGQGFIVGALSLAGFAAGAFLGARLAPLLLSDGSSSPYAPLFALGGAVLLGGLLSSGLGGVGARLRAYLRVPVVGVADALLGAALSACLALAIAWVAGAVALQTPGARHLRKNIQRSLILRHLNAVLPPSGPILHALARVDPVPRINGPVPDVAPPRAAVARDPGVRTAAGSVVKIVGTACGLGVEGSGWAAGSELVVTNAHVVAGEKDIKVEVGGQAPGLSAHAVRFDPRNDVAVLRVPGLGAPALRVAANPRAGTAGAIVGYPHNGPLDIEPARLGPTQTVITSDAYGRGQIARRIASLRGRVRSGNSGGPMVSASGRVLATIFAAATSRPGVGFGVPNDIVRTDLRGARARVGTGPCAE